jgi:hypothetical protein
MENSKTFWGMMNGNLKVRKLKDTAVIRAEAG